MHLLLFSPWLQNQRAVAMLDRNAGIYKIQEHAPEAQSFSMEIILA